MEPVYVARTKEEKQKQNAFFFWWKPVREEGSRGFKSSKGSKGSSKY
jgi:hypothetical protein